jgi:hypothetical protein
MRLALSNLKWRAVETCLASPGWGTLANGAGRVLSFLAGGHYQTGLYRASLKASIAARERGITNFRIENSKLLGQSQASGWVPIHDDPKLFGTVQYGFSVAPDTTSPASICSTLRWQVYYDQSKVNLFAKAAFWITTVNLGLNSILSAIFDAKAKTINSYHLTDYYMGLIEAKNTVIAWYPDFHSFIEDSSRTSFTSSSFLSAFTLHAFMTLTALISLSNFHHHKSPHSYSYNIWDKLSNVALGTFIAVAATVITFDLTLHGAWDYLLVFNKYIFPFGPMNTTDILLAPCCLLMVRGLIKKLL